MRNIIKLIFAGICVLACISFMNAAGTDAYAAKDTTWQEDWTYELDEKEKVICLRIYDGEGGKVVVPAKAVINGKEYKSRLGSHSVCTDGTLRFNNKNNVTDFSVEKGVESDYFLMYAFYRPYDEKEPSSLVSVDLTNLDTTKLINTYCMFSGNQNLKKVKWSTTNTCKLEWTPMMFYGCSGLTELDLGNIDTSDVGSMYNMFAHCESLKSLDVSNFKTSKCKTMERMFQGCSSLQSIDVSGFDTSKVTNMNSMFASCSSLTELDLSNFDTSKVEDMFQMFGHCSNLEKLNVSSFDTSNVTDMENMFAGCELLKKIDVSGFDTSKVESMGYMFNGCEALEELDVSGFKTPVCESFYFMFSCCEKLKVIDVSGFSTENCTTVCGMFNICKSVEVLDLSNFDLSNVTNTGYLFSSTHHLYKLSTPINNTEKIHLYKPMHDESGNEYSDIPAGMKKSITLTREIAGINDAKEDSSKDQKGEEDNKDTKDQKDEKANKDTNDKKDDSKQIGDDYIEGLNLKWNIVNGKYYWYENGYKQGTLNDPKGVMGKDPETGIATNRGREICDNDIKDNLGNGTWFWLDSVFDGARAVGKEVWMPYIYQDEAKWTTDAEIRQIANESDKGMSDCVFNAIKNHDGKWVRYDNEGKMMKGWITICGELASCYPDQVGNTYYYDYRTGLMAKGWVTLDGVNYHFDEVSGVLK